ncbi:MAG: alpha/beta hydrolase, partial [Hyphomicrobiales bacterium]
MHELNRLIENAGPAETTFSDALFEGRPLTLYSYRPRRFTPQTPVLFAHHGRSRNGRDYRDYFQDAAESHDLLVIAPQFSIEAFPG